MDFSYSRSSGAGGQNVNKLNTRVTLQWDIRKTKCIDQGAIERFLEKFSGYVTDDGLVQITSQRFRTQGRNTADTVEKLEAMIEEVLTPPKKRKPTKPKRSAVEKRLKEKKALGEKKQMRRQSY